jgi:hypothetical protein
MKTSLLLLSLALSLTATSQQVNGFVYRGSYGTINPQSCLRGPFRIVNPVDPGGGYFDAPNSESGICTNVIGGQVRFAPLPNGLIAYNEKGEFVVMISFFRHDGIGDSAIREFNNGVH